MNNGRTYAASTEFESDVFCSMTRNAHPSIHSRAAWKSSCEAKRLKTLKEENANLKKLLAEQMLDVFAHRDLRAKMAGPAAKRDVAAHLKAEMGLSERRACQAI